MMRNLRAFYDANPDALRTLTDILNPPAGAKPPISLRVLDWLITNYARRRRVITQPGGDTLNIMYRAVLNGLSKKYFDPFRRRARVEFADADGNPLETTIGQLKFFKWAICNGVVAYGIAHAQDIERDMLRAAKKRLKRRAGTPRAEPRQTPAPSPAPASPRLGTPTPDAPAARTAEAGAPRSPARPASPPPPRDS